MIEKALVQALEKLQIMRQDEGRVKAAELLATVQHSREERCCFAARFYCDR